MSTSIGYRAAIYNLEELKALCPDSGEVDTTLQSIHSADGGLLLHTSEASALQDTSDASPILLLTYSYVNPLLSPEAEQVAVGQARLDAVRFVDADLQEKYGHLFNPELIGERRASMRMERLSDIEPAKRYLVLRAMDADCKHLLAMDYCYLSDSFAINSLAKRVLNCYENGVIPRTEMERSLLNTLNHAVTCALYNGSAQHVTSAVVQNNKIYKARNPGEFFYDGDAPVKTQSLFHICENGVVSLSPSKKELESAPQLL